MDFAIERRGLEAAFTPGRLAVVPPGRLSGAVTHEGARRFLTGVGLPVVSGFLYEPEDALTCGLPDADEFEPEFDTLTDLPETAASWVALGFCHGDTLFLDGTTGLVWALPQGEVCADVANGGVDRLARFLADLFAEWDAFDEGTPRAAREAAAGRLRAAFAAVDAVATGHPGTLWNRILDGLVLAPSAS
ncbi:SUKH-4 family immunity protein [Streptomyces sp. RFCAC02]|uniref:SUKH-4 family immunity protein n=1 Tax=Streptomyces sp. RFCAC02 TaxID=2499143 RepID=UPI00143CCAEC|nr:SUKH-4 family immunity protein [Streptomyces sp. RFCAC02]